MIIETKYNIGDEVWFINHNKVCVSFITDIRVRKNKTNIKVEYHIEPQHKIVFGVIKEQELFSTKEELLKSL